MMTDRLNIVAECWTCAYNMHGCDDTECYMPIRLTHPRAEYHRQHGHDVRDAD